MIVPAAALGVALAATAAKAIYNSPYYSYVSYENIIGSGLLGTCSNPNFSQAANDGIGTIFGLAALNQNVTTSIGYSIGRYTSNANAYTGYFVDNVQSTAAGGVTETFYPFTNRTPATSAQFNLQYSGGTQANAYINSVSVLTGIPEVNSSYDAFTAGLHQAIASGGSPQVFANFTSGADCQNMEYAPEPNGSAYVYWPSSPGGNVVVTQKDPPGETSLNGTYSLNTFTVTH